MLVNMEREQERSGPKLFLSRTRVDRRRVYSLDYYEQGGAERRQYGVDRRLALGERRNEWAKEGRWCSVHLCSSSDS